MNPEQILTRVKALAASLSRRQLITIGATFVGVVGLLVAWAYWLNAPNYQLLFSDMDPEAASQVVDKLKAEKIAYELTDNGRAVRVPADKVDELRLDLSAQGLPASGRIGFELFDRTQFGATEFLEQVNYRRALEGELARTICTLREVEGARVHIAMAKDSLFTEREQPAKASVVLKLRRRGSIDSATVNGIANMMAASIEGLKPDDVVILDSYGRQLNRPHDDDSLSGPQLDRQRDIERALSTRVVSLLEPIVGVDRVRVNVSAQLNPSSQETTEEHWDPNSVVRSHQITTDANGSPAVGGVAGARANLPPPIPASPGSTPPAKSLAAASTPTGMQTATHSSETTNYEISRVTRHSITPSGEVARLSVAVILDDATTANKDKKGNVVYAEKPIPAAEIQKIQGLVAAAVGLDPARGDQLTIENIPFGETPVDVTAPDAIGLQRYMRQLVIGGIVGVVLLLAFVGFLVSRRLQRSKRRRLALQAAAAQAASGAAQQLPRTVKDLESEIEAELDALTRPGEPRKLPVLTRRVGGLVSENPRGMAQLLRSWMAEDPR